MSEGLKGEVNTIVQLTLERQEYSLNNQSWTQLPRIVLYASIPSKTNLSCCIATSSQSALPRSYLYFQS